MDSICVFSANRKYWNVSMKRKKAARVVYAYSIHQQKFIFFIEQVKMVMLSSVYHSHGNSHDVCIDIIKHSGITNEEILMHIAQTCYLLRFRKFYIVNSVLYFSG